MQALTREQEELLRRLVDLAGHPLILQIALKELAQQKDEPSLEALIRKIVEVRNREAHTPAPA